MLCDSLYMRSTQKKKDTKPPFVVIQFRALTTGKFLNSTPIFIIAEYIHHVSLKFRIIKQELMLCTQLKYILKSHGVPLTVDQDVNFDR